MIFSEFLWELVPSARQQLVTVLRVPAERWLSSFAAYHRQTRKMGKSAEVSLVPSKSTAVLLMTRFGAHAIKAVVLEASKSASVRDKWTAPHLPSEMAFNSQSFELGGRALATERIRSGEWLALITERLDEVRRSGRPRAPSACVRAPSLSRAWLTRAPRVPRRGSRSSSSRARTAWRCRIWSTPR